MKIAFIILAHKNPEQLSRLVNRLNTPDTIFSIHIDSGASLELFREEVSKSIVEFSNIQFINKRYRSRWGGFNVVRATIELVKSVIKYSPDYIFLISGQDYPLKGNNYIRDYLKKMDNHILIEYKPFVLNANTPNRINRYFFYDYFDYAKSPIIPRLLAKILPKRNFINEMQPFIGRQWFAIPLDVANYLVNEVFQYKKLIDFYKFCLLPDEMFFQTLLMNSKFSNRIVNVRTHYADYSTSHPSVWETKDFDRLKVQSNLFARKFDMNIDEGILDLLDINNKEA